MEEKYSKKEKLDKLERKLYSRNAPEIIDKGRTKFGEGRIDEEIFPRARTENPQALGVAWHTEKKNNFDELAAKMSKMADSKHSFLKRVLLASVIFFALAAGVATFVFLGGVNQVSSKNVDIKVIGPLSIGGGQEVSYDINIINNNNVDLESASLLVEYPVGARSADDLSKELDRERFVLKTIKSGENFNQNIKIVFFGEKDSLKQIKISLEYRIENSSALFYKEKIYEVSISSAPVILTATYPKEANSNQVIDFDIEIASNSKDKINNLLVNAEYPFGFIVKSASPNASYGNNTWKLSSLGSGEKRKIRITGNIIGQDNEEKVFRISAGTSSSDDERKIAVSLTELTESILVQKPFVGVDLTLDGKGGNITAQGGKEVNARLIVHNNLSSRLFNVTASVFFKGGAFNRLSVVPSNEGFFQSSNDSILWDKRGVPEFSDMDSGSERELSFRLSPLAYSNIGSTSRPEIEIMVKVIGERILDSGSVEQVETVETRKIVLATDLFISSSVTRSLGNLENSGPIPPKVNTPTTYTIIWSIENSFNQVSNAEVRATLPSYVKWTNLHSPQSEIFSFNDVTKEIIWKIGSILPNAVGSSKKEIYFQVEFLPSSSQLGQAPPIVGEAKLTGLDKVTGAKVEARAGAATTNFAPDPSFRSGDDKVVP